MSEKAASTIKLRELVANTPALRLKEALLEILKSKEVSMDTHRVIHDACTEALQLKLEPLPKKKS